jgi:hypothetical protein
LDLDIPLIQEHLAHLGQDFQVEIYDDRASDAFFITVVVNCPDITASSWQRVKKAILDLPEVIVSVVDKHGNETPIETIHLEELQSILTR